MITIYGSEQCPKTVKILALCKERGIEAEYCSFEKDLKSISEFVIIRDKNPSFDKTKAAERLGIPGIICENGFVFDGGEEPFDADSVMRTIAENASERQ